MPVCNQRPASTAPTNRSNDNVKVAKPDFFHGERSKLDDWLHQLMIFFRMEGINQDAKKTVIASSYLRGKAQQWIRPRLQDVPVNDRDIEGIFNNWNNFVEAIRNIYGLSNDKQVAIRVIQHLTQKTSTSQYTAKFREYSGKTGLKDNVKDELMRSGAAQDTLERMIQAAIEIDDKLYERQQEKRHNGPYRGRSGYNPTSWTGGSRRDPDAMELDIIQRKPEGKGMRGAKGKGKFQGNSNRGKKREGPECYNCHKIGHYARDCRGRKVRPQEQLNMMLVKEPIDESNDGRGAYDVSKLVEEPKTEPNHKAMHWTGCYDDYCKTHESDKQASGYYPKKPRKARMEFNMMVQRQPLQQKRDLGNSQRGRSPPPFNWEDATLQENTPPEQEEELLEEMESLPNNDIEPKLTGPKLEQLQQISRQVNQLQQAAQTLQDQESHSSEYEYTDDDEPDDLEVHRFEVSRSGPARKMILFIANQFEAVFPKIQGKRRLHPIEFDTMLDQLRAMFWNYRLVNIDYDAAAYVLDRPPIGSIFQRDGSYITPDGIHISRGIGERIRIVKGRLHKLHRIQEAHQEDLISLEAMKNKLTEAASQWELRPIGQPVQLPLWRNMILGHVKATVKGQVKVSMTQGKVILGPKNGPLDWEICLEDANSPGYYSKNEVSLPTGAVASK
ncbi:hypothetical protein KC365_g14651 [Hortaea werneckii]|nr:hypothetical protein KC365_g14651 [Hortaea werneckii]